MRHTKDFTSSLAALLQTNTDLTSRGPVFLVVSTLSLPMTKCIWMPSGSSNRIHAIPLPLINLDELLAHDSFKAVLKKLETKFSSSFCDTAVNAIRLTYGHPFTLSFLLPTIERAVRDQSRLPENPTLVRPLEEFALVLERLQLCSHLRMLNRL